MNLLEIKTAVASFLDETVDSLTVNGQDLGLLALNQVRRNAELLHDFEFSRKLVTVSVNGTTGGSLTTAVVYGTAQVVALKSPIEVGFFDDDNNLRPVEWTTVAESLERQRNDAPYSMNRYPTDGEALSGPLGFSRFNFSGSTIFHWPMAVGETYTIGIEGYTFTPDWTSFGATTITGGTGVTAVNTSYYVYGTFNSRPLYLNFADTTDVPATVYAIWYSGTEWRVSLLTDVGSLPTNYHSLVTTSTSPAGSYTPHGTFTGTAVVAVGNQSDVWTDYGSEYLIWASVSFLNNLFKSFVFRQEGNLPPPDKQAAIALEAFKQWDVFNYEQSRRHGR